MAVTIIKRGTLPEDRPYRYTCGHCQTVFEFLRTDAAFVSDQRDGDVLSIACPVCNRNCTTDAHRAPMPSKK